MGSPGIGDPHVMGWVTVAAYFAAAALALLVAIRVKHLEWEDNERRNRIFWLLLMLLMVCLGLNKQLDLQTFFTALAKCSAKMSGWYEDRRQYQVMFIVAIGGLFVIFGAFLLWYFRGEMSHNWWAIVGVVFLMSFVFMRASSFHGFDALINFRLYGIRMNWVLELSGIALICIQSLLNLQIERKYMLEHPDE